MGHRMWLRINKQPNVICLLKWMPETLMTFFYQALLQKNYRNEGFAEDLLCLGFSFFDIDMVRPNVCNGCESLSL